jgi:SAM-dependent methyltransferase
VNGESVSRCPICESSAVDRFIDLGEVPVFCNVQWPTREQAAKAAKASLALVSCSQCGHIFNDRYDAALLAYSPGYDNTQHFSSTFGRYADALVGRLIDSYGIRGKTVVDIGCGRGDLLRLLCSRGSNRGFGFDPSFAGAMDPEVTADLTISKEYFTREHGQALEPSLVCCRHVLEHVPEPIEFLRTMRAAIDNRNRPVFYLEVPNGEHLLRSLSLWDYIYEHVSYFSQQSLELALRKAGFEVLKLYEDFGGQFLCADVRPAQQAGSVDAKPINNLQELIVSSAKEMNAKLDRWRSWAAALTAQDRRAAVWGAGSKGVMFLNLLSASAPDAIAYVIDQNPNKHGQYVSGSGQQVVAATELANLPVSQLVLMNPIYVQEVRQRLNALHIDTELVTA